MPLLERGDGVELYWEERGEGPTVVIACHWSGYPPVFEPLIAELVPDHRVVFYDARGTGRSTRRGPHDMLTGASDLVAVIERAGGPAVIITLAEGCNRAVRVAASRPDLARAIVAPGTLPIPRQALAGTEALASSDAVVSGFIDMLATQYRAAQRTMMATSNPQMSEDQVRERVDLQVAYCPQEVAIERLRAWVDDDPLDAARECADRLWILSPPQMAGPWFPPAPQVRRLISMHLPDAHLEEIADGLVSRPDLTADVVRRITWARDGEPTEDVAAGEGMGL